MHYLPPPPNLFYFILAVATVRHNRFRKGPNDEYLYLPNNIFTNVLANVSKLPCVWAVPPVNQPPYYLGQPVERRLAWFVSIYVPLPPITINLPRLTIDNQTTQLTYLCYSIKITLP